MYCVDSYNKLFHRGANIRFVINALAPDKIIIVTVLDQGNDNLCGNEYGFTARRGARTTFTVCSDRIDPRLTRNCIHACRHRRKCHCRRSCVTGTVPLVTQRWNEAIPCLPGCHVLTFALIMNCFSRSWLYCSS